MRHSKAIGLLLLLLLVGSMGVLGWLTYRQMKQDRLNHILIAAIQREDVPAGLAALKAGADPNSRQDISKPLSCWQSLRRLFSGLWRHDKALPTQPGDTALMLALKRDRIVRTPFLLAPLIQALAARGANVNVGDSDGATPLMLATTWEPIHTVRALLDKGADVNARNIVGDTALRQAVMSDSSDAVKLYRLTYKKLIGKQETR